MDENVLLLCLSKVNFKNGLTNYVYDSNGAQISPEGYMTNEAPAMVVLSLEEKLDRIVVICSKDVEKKLKDLSKDPSKNPENNLGIDNAENWKKVAEHLNISVENKKQLLEGSSFDYYRRVVSNYATKENKMIPEFCPISISNTPKEHEVAKVAVSAAEYILGSSNEENNGKKINLYIDYNGGQRYIASMLLNTADLMEQRGVTIKNVLTMNYENRDEEGRVRVESFMGVLQSSKLVSGIKEYVDYGRCKELKDYFKNCKDKGITNILKKMDSLAHHLQICYLDDEFWQVVGDLKTSLESYEKDESKVYSVLFKYVAEDIQEGYRPLFSDDLLDIIDWCLDKDYIQQALTFYAERIAIYSWDNKIYYPTEDEESEYRQIEQVCRYIKECRKELDEDPKYKKAKSEKKSSMELALLKKNHNEFSDITLEQLEYLHQQYLNYDWKASWMGKYLQHSKDPRLNWMKGELRNTDSTKDDLSKNGRVRSYFVTLGTLQDTDVIEKQKNKTMEKILENYRLLKQQRNAINHADNEEDAQERWDYNRLSQKLRSAVKQIREFMIGA